jgi:hypothetical protein
MWKTLVRTVQQLLQGLRRKLGRKTSSAQARLQRPHLGSFLEFRYAPPEPLHFQMGPRIEPLKLKMFGLHYLQAQRVLARVPPTQIQLRSRSALYSDLAVTTATTATMLAKAKVIPRD